MAGRSAFSVTSRQAPWWSWVVLLGLFGQMIVMAAARPGEMPRATLERLTGHVITQAAVMVPMAAGTSCDSMGMHHGPHKPGHDADAGCFLCPLLTLSPIVFAALAALPAPAALIRRALLHMVSARAPPSRVWVHPLPRGPPSLF